jgi:capsular exopolysaccharide synthesis family protein
MVVGVSIGLVLGTLFYFQVPPTFQSAAQVLVVNRHAESDLPLPGAEGRSYHEEDFLATHSELIRSPKIVGDAVNKDHLRNLKTLAGLDNPTGYVMEYLAIDRKMKNNSPTNILNIAYRGSDPDDCGIILKAVLESYRSYLHSKYQNVSDETANLILKAKDALENKLVKYRAEYQQFRRQHPMLWKGKDGVNVLQERLFSIESKRSVLLIRQTEIESSIATFEKAMKDGASPADLLAMVSDSARRLWSDGKATKPVTEEPIALLRTELDGLLDTFGPEHPKVRAISRRIEALQKQERLAANVVLDPALSLDPVKAHVGLLKRERDDTRGTAEELSKLLLLEQEKAKQLVGEEGQDEEFKKTIAQSEELFNITKKRLDEINVLKQFGGYDAEVIAPAEQGKKVSPRMLPVFGIAAFLGLLAGCGLAYLAELSDQSFHTPEEIRRRLGLPVVGHIPYFVPKESDAEPVEDGPQLDPALWTVHHPKSRESEAYRGVRTALFFSNRRQGDKVIQVTSPDMGDGKTTLAANLAVSIAQAGQRVILVDADLRRPRVHLLFDVSSEQGLVSVVSGEAELVDVVQATGLPGLFVLPAGPIPDHPAELLTLPQFKQLLAVLREQYDFVVIDTPPLLAVTDPCVVVPYVDGILLTIRISKNAQPHAQRAKEILGTLDAKILGVVVNGVGRDADTYGYYNYHYNYTYKSYGYYSDKDSADGYYSNGEDGGAREQNGAGVGEGPGKQETRADGRPRKPKGLLRRLFNV